MKWTKIWAKWILMGLILQECWRKIELNMQKQPFTDFYLGMDSLLVSHDQYSTWKTNISFICRCDLSWHPAWHRAPRLVWTHQQSGQSNTEWRANTELPPHHARAEPRSSAAKQSHRPGQGHGSREWGAVQSGSMLCQKQWWNFITAVYWSNWITWLFMVCFAFINDLSVMETF